MAVTDEDTMRSHGDDTYATAALSAPVLATASAAADANAGEETRQANRTVCPFSWGLVHCSSLFLSFIHCPLSVSKGQKLLSSLRRFSLVLQRFLGGEAPPSGTPGECAQAAAAPRTRGPGGRRGACPQDKTTEWEKRQKWRIWWNRNCFIPIQLRSSSRQSPFNV